MTNSSKITFVTGNKNKLREVNEILGARLTNQALDLDELQGSIDEVSMHKAKTAAEIIGGPVLVEDTALEFEALGGMPGPYIKWFMEKIGCQGLYDMLYKFENKNARAVCTFAYCAGPGQPVQLFQGTNEGTIVEPRGEGIFGWNPIFQPNGFTQTYAEMDGAVKNSISHRSRALAKLAAFLDDLDSSPSPQ
ncbi:inosine triphosphate pyrophosphatase [Trichomonascus vanleenenianus]|uniref:nucleoside triphosphate pyrophosphohydrolase HAM1 n=1 Tax=Trichomonascus vanleenenianus TaxID=2268995 RepID=UPI003EC9E004